VDGGADARGAGTAEGRIRPGLGLDQHFLSRAPGAGKKVRTLETAMEQIDFLESLSPQLQEGLVAASFEGADTELQQVQKIAAAWKAGDTAPIERLLASDMKSVDAAVYETLLVGRNRRWVPQIEDCLSQQRCFVVVGARPSRRPRRPGGNAQGQRLHGHAEVGSALRRPLSVFVGATFRWPDRRTLGVQLR
jgi:hypothetical protein